LSFRLTKRGVTVAAIALTVLVVLIGVALAATSTARFCGACKSHVPYVDEWSQSAHDGVNCEQCHTKPGPFFFLTSKLEALQQPIAQITGDYEKPILGFVLNQSCRRCHTNENLFKNVSSGGIIVNHEHLIEAGFLCQRCHSTTAHGEAVPEGSRTYPTMEQCLICHNNDYTAPDGTVATSRCDQCHAKPGYAAVPESHDQPDWDTRHGAIGVLSTCSACHLGKDSCADCHSGILMPHPDPWLYQHGTTAQVKGRDSCAQCHNVKEYCKTCHQVPMPHPENFIASHPEQAERYGTPTCFNCHVLDNCQACHEQHAAGDPRAHSLFNGLKYTPPPRATSTATPVPGSEQ
jgi:trimethylamine-N-oxide reductase cytochrome c-type subunit TorC